MNRFCFVIEFAFHLKGTLHFSGASPPCYVDAKRTVDAVQAAQDRTVIAEITLVELQGSPKQVAWAGTIRMKRIAALHRTGSGAVARLARIAEAKWWIDHRDLADDGLLARSPVASQS